ncbi:Hypothetical predicted protein, partial [Marmota monax]
MDTVTFNQTWSVPRSSPLGRGSNGSGGVVGIRQWVSSSVTETKLQLQLWGIVSRQSPRVSSSVGFSCIHGSGFFCGSSTQKEDLQVISGWQQQNQRKQQWLQQCRQQLIDRKPPVQQWRPQ